MDLKVHHYMVQNEGGETLVSTIQLATKHEFTKEDVEEWGIHYENKVIIPKKQEHEANLYDAMLSMIPKRHIKRYLQE